MRDPICRWPDQVRVLFLALLVAPLMAIAISGAAACDSAPYDHNGSRMEVHACDGRLVIAYDVPRDGLARAGVAPGTILFEGFYEEKAGGASLSGDARLFNRRCGPVRYEINGWMEGNSIVMEGMAPIRSGGCTISGRRTDILRFRGL